MKKDLISVNDLTREEIIKIFITAKHLKDKTIDKEYTLLRGKTLAMIFQKPSTRTRVSFEVGMYQLGGHPIFLKNEELQIKRGETFSDTAKILSRYVDLIMIRANKHKDIIELAEWSTVPVINGLSELEHPCQILSDIYTVIEKLKFGNYNKDIRFWENLDLSDIKITYIGDGNNICNSLLLACAIFGMKFTVATPKGYEPDIDIFNSSQRIAKSTGAVIELINDPIKAVRNSDIIYTDVWVSMGEEEQKKKNNEYLKVFMPYQVNNNLVSKSKNNVLIMHCLPAHRGEEITDDVIDSENSIIFDQAENRLHVQKAILLYLSEYSYDSKQIMLLDV
jgi:ornithine carbamoyltransferase